MTRCGRIVSVLLVVALAAAPLSASVCAVQCVPEKGKQAPAASKSHCGSTVEESSASHSSITNDLAMSLHSGEACHVDAAPAAVKASNDGLRLKALALNSANESSVQSANMAAVPAPLRSPPPLSSSSHAHPLRI